MAALVIRKNPRSLFAFLDKFLDSPAHATFACAIGLVGGTYCAYTSVRYKYVPVSNNEQDRFVNDVLCGTCGFCFGASFGTCIGYILPFFTLLLVPAVGVSFVTAVIARARARAEAHTANPCFNIHNNANNDESVENSDVAQAGTNGNG